MNYTGERYVDWAPGLSRLRAEHLVRYGAAAAAAENRLVLDLGCGTLYGAPMLMDGGARAVFALDLSLKALAAGRERHGAAGILPVRGDALSLPFAPKTFGLAAVLEVIEHVEDAGRLLDEVRRVLDDGGTLALSTPRPDPAGPRPFHVKEFGEEELRRLLQARWKQVVILEQASLFGSLIRGRGAGEVRFPPPPLESAGFFALASDNPLPDFEPCASLFPLESFEAETLERLRGDIAHLVKENRGLKEDLSTLRSSKSWRIMQAGAKFFSVFRR